MDSEFRRGTQYGVFMMLDELLENGLSDEISALRHHIIQLQYQHIQMRLNNYQDEIPPPSISLEDHDSGVENLNLQKELSQRQCKHFEETAKLSKDTQKSLDEMLQFLEQYIDVNKIDDAVITAQERLYKAQLKFNNILDSYFPHIKDDFVHVLKALEKSKKAKNEDDQYMKLDISCLKQALHVLIKAKVIEAHPVKKYFFRLAPFL